MRYIVVLTQRDDNGPDAEPGDFDPRQVIPCTTVQDVQGALDKWRREDDTHNWAVFELTKGRFERRSLRMVGEDRTVIEEG